MSTSYTPDDPTGRRDGERDGNRAAEVPVRETRVEHARAPQPPVRETRVEQAPVQETRTEQVPVQEPRERETVTRPVSGARTPDRAADDLGLDRKSVVARQEDRYGGIKVGSAFFGWLTATGMAAILIALLSAAGAAVGLSKNLNVSQAASQASAGTATAKTVGLVSGIALLVILFLAYYCGGYVAGRMARFAGTRQGLAVWLWAVLIAIAVAILAAVAGSKYNVLAQLNLPRIPINEGTLSTGGIIAAIAIVVVTLVGALLGGKAGMHFHRKVDREGLGR